MVRVWGELVPCGEFINTDGMSEEKKTELWVRVKYSPVLYGHIEGHIDYKGTYAHHLYLQLIEDPTSVFEYHNYEDFLRIEKDYVGD